WASVVMMTAAYWSLISLLGSRTDSSRSRALKRPEACVRSGPIDPPSLAKRWQAKHFASPKSLRPLSKSRPVSFVAQSGARWSIFHFLTRSRGGPTTTGPMTGFALRMGARAVFSASVQVARASDFMRERKPSRLLPPRKLAAFRYHEKYVLRCSGVQPVFAMRSDLAYS